MNKEIQSLVNQLNAASDAYYNGRDELMTDYEWDAAFDKLKKLEEETGIILPDLQHKMYLPIMLPVKRKNMSSLHSPWQRLRR